MEEIYARASTMASKTPGEIPRANYPRRLLRALGRETLHKNGEWLALHRCHPPTVPIH